MTKPSASTILFAGFCSQLLCLGIARFAYTPLLAPMLAEGLPSHWGALLASINYLGYVAGALVAFTVTDWRLKWYFYRIGLIFAVASTLGMGLTEQIWLWAFWRFIAGLAAAAAMLLASGLILQHLRSLGKQPELGIHFAGLGLGIVLVAACSHVMSLWFYNSSQQWLGFSILALLLLVPAWLGLPAVTISSAAASNAGVAPLSRLFYSGFFLMYFCAGYGYVVTITFVVAISTLDTNLQAVGHWAFLVLGAAAAPAALLWDRIARQLGYLATLRLAAFVNGIAIILPVLFSGKIAFIAAAMLFGASFIGCVSLVLTIGGRLNPAKPARLMAALTLCYGSAQIIAPAISAMLLLKTANYTSSLLVAALMMLCATLLLTLLSQQLAKHHWLRSPINHSTDS